MLLLPQGETCIGEHDQLVRHATLAKDGATLKEAIASARQLELDRPHGAALETRAKPQLGGGDPQHPLGRTTQDLCTVATHQPQAPLGIEGKDPDLRFFHHPAQQGRRFERSQTLFLE